MVTSEKNTTTSDTPRRPLLAVGAAVALLATGCTHEGSATAEVPTATPSVAPVPAGTVYRALGRVCDGFFTQPLADGKQLVIGRPVVDAQMRPFDAVATSKGVSLELQEYGPAPAVWCDMDGKQTPATDIACAERPLYARKFVQPNRMQMWVTSTRQEGVMPRAWDAAALEPAVEGAALHYGAVEPTGVTDILRQAAQQ